MTHFYQPEGTEVSETGIERLREMFTRQRVDAEGMLDRLKEERSRSIDFITDTTNLGMLPVPEQMKAELPEIDQTDRTEIHQQPQVLLAPEKKDEEWFKHVGPIALNENAHGQLCGTTPIGRKYYNEMLATKPDLLALNVNEWLQTQPKRRLVRARLTKENGSGRMGFARAYLSNSYRRMDNLEVAESMLPLLMDESEGWIVRQCAVTDRRIHIEAVYPQISTSLAVGEAAALAVKITSGEVGGHALAAHFGVETLICTNLMMVPAFSKRMIHLGGKEEEFVEFLSEKTIRAEDQLRIDKMRDVVKAMAEPERFAQLVSGIEDAQRATLKDPIAATEVLATGFGLRDFEANAIQNEMMSEGNPTLWGLVSAVTATTRSLDFERKADLEARAGALIHDPKSWPQYVEAAA